MNPQEPSARRLVKSISLLPPQGAGKCIIKDPEPPHLFQSATIPCLIRLHTTLHTAAYV